MADSKHQQLVNSIRDAVVAELKPLLEAQTAQNGAEFANVNTLIAALVARFEVIEKGAATTGAPKRPPRGGRKTGGATAAKTDSDYSLDKVINGMLYTRLMWADEAWKARYMTEAVQAKIDGDNKTTKHAEGSEARCRAEGGLFWLKCASEQQKKEIRDEWNRWKEERKRSALAEPLGADDGAVDDGADDVKEVDN